MEVCLVLRRRHEAPGDGTCHDVVGMMVLSVAFFSNMLVYDTQVLSHHADSSMSSGGSPVPTHWEFLNFYSKVGIISPPTTRQKLPIGVHERYTYA